MEQVKQNLESLQSNMDGEQMEENLEHLKDLVDNLLSLSYSQEDLMNEFKALGNGDPRYVQLSQNNLKSKITHK